MKKLLLTVTLTSLFSAAAMADDSGPYVGVHIAHGWGKHDVELLDNHHRSQGILGGLQIGYAYKVNGLMLGIEADYALSGIKSDDRVVFSPVAGSVSTTDIQHKVKNFGTIRGRVGKTFGKLTPYVTGGLAFAENDSSASAVIAGFGPLDGTYRGSHKQGHRGYAIGAGVEYPYSPKVSVRLEYLHANLGEERYTSLPALDPTPRTHSVEVDVIRLGLNYQF